MAIRNLRFGGDAILRKTSKEVKEITPKVKELSPKSDDMRSVPGNYRIERENQPQLHVI